MGCVKSCVFIGGKERSENTMYLHNEVSTEKEALVVLRHYAWGSGAFR